MLITSCVLLFQVNEECQVLRDTLSQVEADCQAAKTQVAALQTKVHSLEETIQVMYACVYFIKYIFI